MSATPGPYEEKHAPDMIEQVVRPTGLLDPQITIKPVSDPGRRFIIWRFIERGRRNGRSRFGDDPHQKNV